MAIHRALRADEDDPGEARPRRRFDGEVAVRATPATPHLVSRASA
jgi:hypothetical protein